MGIHFTNKDFIPEAQLGIINKLKKQKTENNQQQTANNDPTIYEA